MDHPPLERVVSQDTLPYRDGEVGRGDDEEEEATTIVYPVFVITVVVRFSSSGSGPSVVNPNNILTRRSGT